MISEGCSVSSLSQLPLWRTKKDPNTMFFGKLDFYSKKDEKIIIKMIDLIIDITLIDMKGEEVLDKINPYANFRSDLGLSRLEICQLVDTLGQKLQITIGDYECFDIEKVSQLRAIIFLGLFELSHQKN